MSADCSTFGLFYMCHLLCPTFYYAEFDTYLNFAFPRVADSLSLLCHGYTLHVLIYQWHWCLHTRYDVPCAA